MDKTSSGTILRFAGVVLDGPRGCLRGLAGAEVPLVPQAFDLPIVSASNTSQSPFSRNLPRRLRLSLTFAHASAQE